MLQWFRRKKRPDEPAPARERAEPSDELVTTAPAETGEPTQPRKRRRRGSRGGRNRRKPSETAERSSEAKKEPADKPQRTGERRRSERGGRQARGTTRKRTATPRTLPPPAKRELVISVDVAEQRVAVLEDDKVAEVYLERDESRSIAGNIYKGTVDNVLPGMEAAFVEIGLEKNGFLYVDEIVTPELEGRRQGRKIQDLLSRGEEILVQAVKDPMKSKGARLTTEISLPGRFVVYVPSGEGFGVSRRLPDDERSRLREILKSVGPKKGGVIVRTAAEGASAEDIERDIDFLERLWKAIQDQAKQVEAPSLVYQEAELPLRVIRDLFTNDFERAVVDHDLTYKRIVGYLKKTSPHMAEKVQKHTGKTALFEELGVEDEIRSTLSRRVDLPSGGYLVFDYAEAFTVIDVNTGRFVGSRSKSSGQRLEDTITKNNLEAVKEVVRQLRLRDIGGIIVIDFIDMANPKNRGAVEDALKSELERDRTKTYVVEISPLGLVEMTRQNVAHGPREILTKRCPTCHGDGIVVSETSAAVEAERKLRALAAASRTGAFKVELNAHVATILIGPGAARLQAIEDRTRRRFFLVGKEGMPADHFEVLDRGPVAKLQPESPVAEGEERQLKLVEVGLHDSTAGVAKEGDLTIAVAGAAGMVGKRVKLRVERVLDGTAYATLAGGDGAVDVPITAEALAEKPTRARRSRAAQTKPKAAEAKPKAVEAPAEDAEEPQDEEPAEAVAEQPEVEAAPKKKKTRRGSRGGRRRKKKPAAAGADGGASQEPAVETPSENGQLEEAPVLIHVPDRDLGSDSEETTPTNGEQPPKKKKTRRGSRGGRRRKKPAAAAQSESAETGSEGAD
ncbi:MAG TPA: Rne/Rng family ribonuclease [Gaiellaceae bacterium]|nr:Rne/Rng family ribonuclease [Gaiellaceae bacterium]